MSKDWNNAADKDGLGFHRGRGPCADGGSCTELIAAFRRADAAYLRRRETLRIFVGESDKWQRKPLYRTLVERLRAEGVAGATVFRGIEGFGARSMVHTANILDLSIDLPVVIEVVDTQEHIDRLLPILEIAEGACS